jgi:hypothetical protein
MADIACSWGVWVAVTTMRNDPVDAYAEMVVANKALTRRMLHATKYPEIGD